jgi:sugar/nucleoside kinase (ribokinase family)
MLFLYYIIMKYDFITIGGATEDITFYTKEGVLVDNKEDVLRQKLLAFEYGAKLQIDKAFSTFGGGATNAAVCLGRLGFNVATIVAVGEDFRGNGIIANLKNNNVSTKLVQKNKDAETGFSFFLVGSDKEHICFSNRAANQKLKINDADVKELCSAKWIYMTSLSGNWLEVLNQVFKARVANIAWNPGHVQLHSGIGAIGKFFKFCDMLIVNKDEAIELIISDKNYRNKDNRFLNNVKNLLTIIKKYGPKIVVITNGKHGADAYDGVKYYHQDIIKEKKFINTTGVGDAFGSTFIAGLELFNGNIQKAMKLGITNTASVVSHMGAQNGLLYKKQILRNIK